MTQGYFGGFQFAENELYVRSFSAQTNYTDRGFMRSITKTLTIGGFVTGNASQITTAIQARQNALGVNGYDFYISGTPFELRNAGTLGGVRVEGGGLQFENVDGAQIATRLNYFFTLTAEYKQLENLPGAEIVQYQESVTFSGNGFPLRVIRPCINTDAVEQQTCPNQGYFAQQSGILVTLTPNPPANAPIWPDKIIGAPQYTPVSADVFRGAFVQQGISWNYQFGSSSPLVGGPTNR